jgi:4'-phosphopantetheinyl transferase
MIRTGIDPLSIAGGFFAAAESNQLVDLSPDLQRAAFFRCWARKEAFIKAVGKGVSFGLDRFEVTLLPGDDPAVVRIAGVERAEDWIMADLPVGDDFAAAVAYRGRRKSLARIRFDATTIV